MQGPQPSRSRPQHIQETGRPTATTKTTGQLRQRTQPARPILWMCPVTAQAMAGHGRCGDLVVADADAGGVLSAVEFCLNDEGDAAGGRGHDPAPLREVVLRPRVGNRWNFPP
ncbi:hypothetical protein AMK23_33165 [Streptomyces sp. CB02130]|nr:hypothetical protein AMK23_33165 [Streptomyces sp. CB02130]